jgi:hypothetical protein
LVWISFSTSGNRMFQNLGHLFLLCTIQFAHTQVGEQLQETCRIWQRDAMKCLGVYCVQHLFIDLFYFHFWNF